MSDLDVTVCTEPLGGSPLTVAALAGRAESWYPPAPGTPAEWRARIEEVRASVPADWLGTLAPALAAGGRAAERLERVAGGRGAVITTGQQPGLFGGPIYTWSKAITALALADALEQATGIPVAPVFWAATDDADLAEASTTWVGLPGGAEELRLPTMDGDAGMAGRPMAEIPLPELDLQLATLRRAAGSVSDPSPLELAERAYQAGTTVGDAYVRLLRGLLEPLGIAVLDASHPAVRSAARPVLLEALRRAPALELAMAGRVGEIEDAGFTPQVPLVEGLSPVFVYEPAGKRRVPLAEAAAVAADDEVPLGPNVLLRPVVERSILPTAAYVAGPGELAYFAQVGAVAGALDLAPPLAVPRWSTMLLEPHVRELLGRHDLTPDDLADAHAPERALARASLPEAVRTSLAELRDSAEATARRLAALSDGLVPASVPEGAARAIGHHLERLERRYRAAVRRRETRAFAELGTLRGALRPGGIRQERALNLLPLLARHGTGLFDAMLAAARQHARSLTGSAAADDTAPPAGARARLSTLPRG
ncbi:MAG: bacillithiol biosynthesis protein BshC [Gemmatimonadaceae bacterium]